MMVRVKWKDHLLTLVGAVITVLGFAHVEQLVQWLGG